MLITHAKPAELWGKKVYDAEGRLLREVVAIGSRRGVVRKVVVQRTPFDRPVRIANPADTRVATTSSRCADDTQVGHGCA